MSPATVATVATATGPFAVLATREADGGESVLASGWTAEVDELLVLVHRSLRPESVTVEALAALDAQGHFDLKARNVDGDLKCILKGIAEDLPQRLSDLQAATTDQARAEALKEMGYLLNDNVEVITAPPKPPV